MPARMAMRGYTRNSVTFSISFSPASMTDIMAMISTMERIQRGGAVICSWLTRKLSTVLVMPTP
ncbi:hypothetical protein D3C73_320860 [compost metagenome]